MKRLNIYSTILIIFLFSGIVNADDIIDRLDSPEYYVRYEVVGEIVENQLVQYIPALVERVFNQPTLLLSYRFLEGLYKLGYNDIVQYTIDFIELCNTFPEENPLYYKSLATSILVDLRDFSTLDYVFEFINLDPLKNAQLFMPLLYSIADRDPEYSETVKNLLVMIKDNSTLSISRREAFNYLLQLFGGYNMKNEILTSITDDADPAIRKIAMEHYNFSDRKDVLKQRIQNDTDGELRREYVESFLEEYDAPEDLQFVIAYNITEPDEIVRGRITNLILGFAPNRPDTAVSAFDMTNNLISITDGLYAYQWIRSESKYNSYKNSLNIISKDIQRGLIEDASNKISNMIDQVRFDYNNTPFISIDAWGFLHFHLQYILDKLQ